ncbi:alpha/beta fold hydrolase [Catenulispora yoronensis]|uniref:Alpha/beta fold hydrolase n=1 Tax=Catenulispora yoronensis TaxID=450799 RepID=A0ABN2TUV6_9ACTN
MWLHMSCWEGWAERFTAHGYAVSVPNWPGEARDVLRARRDPGPMRGLGLAELSAHFARLVGRMERPPVVIGHSVGGLIAQQLVGAGLAEAAVAVAPQPGVVSRPSLAAQIWGVPEGHEGFVPLARAQFRHTVANAVGEEEAGRLYDRYALPAPQRLVADLMELAEADPGSRLGLNTENARRGPLLLVSGQEDRLVPDAATRSVYKLYGDSVAVTELKQFADRGHSMVMDSGWRCVADYVLDWLARHEVKAADQGPH